MAGRALWTYRYDGETQIPATPWSYVGDLDGDRRNDIVTAVEVAQRPLTAPTVRLFRFSDTGVPQWSQTVEDRFRFNTGEYGPPWAASNLTVYRSRGESRIAWAVHHYTWWPALLLTLNARGERVGTFVNSGWIHDVQPTRDERHLLISGVTNSRRAYFYAVLDAAHPTGHSPEPVGSEMECETCPQGDPIAYVVFPRTDVGRQDAFPGHMPVIQTFDDGRVQVQVSDGPVPNAPATIYELRSPVEIDRARFSDAFWERHRALEASRTLQHADSACPERQGLNVEIWSPGSGWKMSRVPIVR